MTVLYRGILKSCNYSCTYCPFSKHGMHDGELEKDRRQWVAFVRRLIAEGEAAGYHALLVTPYGEALLHPWYWEGLAQLSVLPWTKAVGAQTNLSFPVDASLQLFEKNGGILSKLRLWATFHPQMTTIGQFAQTCRQLAALGIRLCAGAVGVPEHLALLQQLREALPDEVYLWINRMDGLGRDYTAKEKQIFSKIDPYFYRELLPHPADVSQCRLRLFAEGDGRRRLCNLSQPWKAEALPEAGQEEIQKRCTRKRCSCYLAYGGRSNLVNQMLFGPWPLFRIPRRPKAVFLDIEGTLLTHRTQKYGCADHSGTEEVIPEVQAALEVLAKKEQTLLFFATTLPYRDAEKRCRSIWHLFSGGIFAGGGHIIIEETSFAGKTVHPCTEALDKKEVKTEWFAPVPEECLQDLEQRIPKTHVRMLVYRNKQGICYKITLLRAMRRPWSSQEADEVMGFLTDPVKKQVRCLVEGPCMQIVAAGADKAAGVKKICSWLAIPRKEIFAAGDSKEDIAMMQLNGT